MRYTIFVGEEFHRLTYKQSGIFVNNTACRVSRNSVLLVALSDFSSLDVKL
jgi:hypothetical protein